MSWAVTVSRDGEEIMTIETNCLSARELSPEDEDTIVMAAQHLLSFVGAPRCGMCGELRRRGSHAGCDELPF